MPDQLAFGNSAFEPGTGVATRDLVADSTGLDARYLPQHGINLHTTVNGFITERPVGGNLQARHPPAGCLEG